MRVVADTNIVVSGLLWHGSPRRVLDAAREGRLDLFTSAVLLTELEDVLSREKFTNHLLSVGAMPHDVVVWYATLALLVEPPTVEPVILEDPDDDAVIACAIGAKAEFIVSGDRHLLDLGQYRGIRVLAAAELMSEVS